MGPVEVTSKRGGRALRFGEHLTFRYALLPHIEKVLPSSVSVVGGTVLQLHGSRLGDTPSELLAVLIDGRRCGTLTWDSPSLIGCTAPDLERADGSAGAPSVDVVVYVAAVAAAAAPDAPRRRLVVEDVTKLGEVLPSAAYKLVVASQPRVAQITPSSGPLSGGTRVTLTGSSLGSSKEDILNVTIGTVQCTSIFLAEKHKELKCTTGRAERVGAAPVRIVTTSRGRSLSHPPPPTFIYLPSGLAGGPHGGAAAGGGLAAPAEELSANASGSCCGRSASAAVDGSLRTEWRSPVEPTTTPTTLTLDLGRARWVGRLDVAWGWEYAPAEWAVLLSRDAQAWEEVVEPPALVDGAGSAVAAPDTAPGTTATTPLVMCGGHSAPDCGACPRCGAEWCGAAWCGGDCQWEAPPPPWQLVPPTSRVPRRREQSAADAEEEAGMSEGRAANADGHSGGGEEPTGSETVVGSTEAADGSVESGDEGGGGEENGGSGGGDAGTCVVRPAAPGVTRERRSLMSEACRRALQAEPRLQLWQNNRSSDRSSNSIGHGCHLARYVRLVLTRKQPELASDPIIVKEASVIGLEAFVDGAIAHAIAEDDEAQAAEHTAGSGVGGGGGSGSGGTRARNRTLAGNARSDEAAAAMGGGAPEPPAASLLPPWAQSVLPLLQPSFQFEAVGIGGLDAELRELFRRVVMPRLVSPATRAALRLQVVRGALLHGPPGTGKTLTARKIADLLHVPPERTTVVDGPALVSKFLGESEKNMRDLFVPAQLEQKSKGAASNLHIIIFDELDAICRARGHTDQSAGLVYDSLVNQLLSLLDGVAPLDNVLLLGMTNRKDLIDEALLRPGRFEVQLELKLPDLAGREAILRIHTGALAAQGLLAPSLQLRTIAQRTASFSGASLSGLVRSATSRALSRVVAALPKGATEIPSLSGATLRLRAADFLAAVREVKKARGLSREELRRYRGPLLRHSDAFDEAWHTARRLVAPFASAAPVVAAAAAASSTRSVDKDKDGFGRIGSILISGPAGGGRTSFAAQLAAACNFSFVQVLSADELRGASEGARLHALQTMAEDAAASDTAAIVLDDIERLLGHVLLSHHPAAGGMQETVEAAGAMSPAMLEALLALLRRPPPRGRSLVIIGTTAHYPLIARTSLLHAFDARVELPPLEHPAGVYELLRLAGATPARAAAAEVEAAAPDMVLDEMAEAVPVGATIKQVLRALELSRMPEEEAETKGAEAEGAEAEVEDAEKAAIEAEEAALSAAEAALAAEEAKQKAAASSESAAATRATSSDGALLTATVSAEGVARVDETAESGEAAASEEEAEPAGEAEAGNAEDEEDDDDESPVMVTEPLLYVPVDVARFRELLSLSPWALRLKEHGGGGARTPVAHVHVVGANETMPTEAVRWAGVPSRSRDEGHHTDNAEQF